MAVGGCTNELCERNSDGMDTRYLAHCVKYLVVSICQAKMQKGLG